jgi:hypothetical protein
MKTTRGTNWLLAAVVATIASAALPALADDAAPSNSDVQNEILTLKTRIADLEKKEN